MNATSTAPGPLPARITVVTSVGCHFCHDALDVLDELGREFPLEVSELDLRHPRGRDLVAEHGAGLSPLVLIDDQFVSAGRLPRNKLRKLLTARAARWAGVAR